VLGMELRGSCMGGKCSTAWATPQAPVTFFFFFLAVLGFELRASCG
jgi:hypothetical protein